MATKPINKYTVAEASNLQVYEEYKSEQLTCATNDTYDEGADWSANPAKSITIIPYTGDADGVITFTLQVKGSYGNEIVCLFDDFPITIDNLLIERIKIKTADSTTDEIFTVLSFH